jgi:hypothetical protein
MTNHIPNDLSHLSEAEFNSLCPQGEHAPGPEPLSPAAQAVLDAVDYEDVCLDTNSTPCRRPSRCCGSGDTGGAVPNLAVTTKR